MFSCSVNCVSFYLLFIETIRVKHCIFSRSLISSACRRAKCSFSWLGKRNLSDKVSLKLTLLLRVTGLFGSFGLSTKEPYTILNCHRHWRRHWCHLCTPPPGTGLNKETLYLVYMCTYISHICTSNIYVILTCNF